MEKRRSGVQGRVQPVFSPACVRVRVPAAGCSCGRCCRRCRCRCSLLRVEGDKVCVYCTDPNKKGLRRGNG